MAIFKELISDSEFTKVCPLIQERLSESVTESGNVSTLKPMHKPERLWVLAHADAYRELSITGEDLDLALAHMFAHSTDPTLELAVYGQLLQSPGLISSVISELFPRAGVAISVPQKYARLEATTVIDAINKCTRSSTFKLDPTSAAVKAYNAVVLGVLINLDLASQPEQAYVVLRQEERVATVDMVRRAVLQDNIRSALVSSMVASVKAKLPTGYSPQALSERIAAVFRSMAEFLDSIRLTEQRFATVESVMNAYFTRKDDLALEITTMEEVRDFASHANFLLAMAGTGLIPTDMTAKPLAEIREAFVSIRAAIAGCTDLKEVPLKEYADRFGMVLTYAPGGIRRGAVVYTLPSVSAKMPLVKGTKTAAGFRLRPIPLEYANSQGLAASLSKALLTDLAMESLVSLVADELSRSHEYNQSSDPVDVFDSFRPELRGVDVTSQDLMVLAIAKADTINYRTFSDDGSPIVQIEVVFGVPLSPAWRTEVLAATPKYGYFARPASVVMYTAPEQEFSPKPWPTGPQQLKLNAGAEKLFQMLPNPSATLRTKVKEEFKLNLPYRKPNGEAATLEVNVNPIAPMTSPDIGATDVFVAAVLEPAVSRAVTSRMIIALAYTSSEDPSIASRARSWLVQTLVPILMTPILEVTTKTALNRAIIDSKIDGRVMTAQMVDLHTAAAFGMALAILQRYGLLTHNWHGDIVQSVINAVPPSNMTVAATALRTQLSEQLSKLPA